MNLRKRLRPGTEWFVTRGERERGKARDPRSRWASGVPTSESYCARRLCSIGPSEDSRCYLTRMTEPSQPFLSLAALRKALSPERLAAYALSEDRDDLDAVARYLWNGALAAALTPALHALEVTLRNNLYEASLKVVDQSPLSFRDIQSWLDADPSLLYENEARAVEEAKAVLRRGGKPLTIGRIISKLSFGFWVSLCRSPYEQGRPSGPGLWPAAIPIAFPFLPKGHRNRPAILQRLDEIRELRNRTFHHETIWDRNLPRSHRRILDTLGWMNQGLAQAVQHLSRLDAVYDAGFAAFRSEAERIVRP